jgi:5-methylcytosine-specific restriction endonuclease McrA
MTLQVVNTLFDGVQVLNNAPTCRHPDCNRPAHNIGKNKFRKMCTYHHDLKYGMKASSHKKYRKDYCENEAGYLGYYCTASIVDPRYQLDVDHIDGDPSNDNPDNLMTLCKCCHALKTIMFRDFETKGRKALGIRY